MAEVSISIAGDRWQFWEQVTLTRHLDNFSAVTFTGPFDPFRGEMRAALRPFDFQPVTVEVDGETAITATMLTPLPRGEAEKTTVEVSAYARPAAILDTNLPVSAFPIEWNGLDIGQIASAICGHYGLEAYADVALGAAFKQVKLEADSFPGSMLIDLAKQRGLVIRDAPDGRLLITRSSSPGRPVAFLREGEAPLLSAEVTFSPQDYFSAITGLVKGKPGRRGGKYTADNPFLVGVVRPYTFAAEDIDKGSLPAAVNAKLGRMFGNMVAYVVKVPTWHDESGNLWTPDTTISLEAPSAMVYSPYEFLIRDVILEQDADGETAALGLVLPGAFSGETPRSLPWD